MTISATDRSTLALAYSIHRTPRGLARYISRFASGLGVSFTEALRIVATAPSADAFIRTYENEELWADCHNDCEVA